MARTGGLRGVCGESDRIHRGGLQNADDGSTKYFDKSDVGYDNYDIMKASSAVPVACEPYVIDGVPYYDGGIADPIPVQKAIDDGYDRIVVILTRPKDTVREQKKDIGPATILKRTHPEAAEKLMNRYQTYNDEVALAKEYEKDAMCAHPRAGKHVRLEHAEQVVRRSGTHVPRRICVGGRDSSVLGKLKSVLPQRCHAFPTALTATV